jgi:hypothetical protein
VRGGNDSTSEASVGGGAAIPVLLLSGGWTGIPSKINGSCLYVASVLHLALVTR